MGFVLGRPEVPGFTCGSVSTVAVKFLTADQAAEYLGGLNSRTVSRWAREGYLPAYPIGEGKRRLWRFLEADLQAWMLSRRRGINLSASADTLIPATDAPVQEISLDW
jgi:excisionase family DNA binding protein